MLVFMGNSECITFLHKTASGDAAYLACPTLFPLMDEHRSYCCDHRIEEIPAPLAV
jgi:hypothetical protein